MLMRIHLAAVLAILLTTAAALLIQAGPAESDPLQRWRAGEALRVGYALEPPFAYLDASGRVTGEAPEVWRAVAEELGGGPLIWEHVEFGSLVHELEAGRIDVIASGLFVTPERATRVVFSRPTAHVCPALLVQAGNPLKLAGYEDVAAEPRARLLVVAGAVEGEQARRAGVPEARLLAFPDADSAVVALRQHAAEAFALSAVSLRRALAGTEDHGLELVVATRGTAGLPAFAFRPDDLALRAATDSVLDGFLGSERHATLIARFGFTSAELPGRDGDCGS
ncbi:transporter substrate-binding domain-containing protein [Azoarcus indigens]|uniref:Amino acid ABC transporter substrate-binding protein (PAAT family) n=1 Tax=Azoarcus indigens TaxID=29545 RepID=A0A4R6EEH6_9RHOO|nr:transporter substrate-binding domain-containing protein [Azoarcus indigens]TDN56154.1 amino acid ABC transporter substrate-binding protein (PAAT family) [Azoarcus indigens]